MHLHKLTPKGTVITGALILSNLIFRQSLSSACQVALIGLCYTGCGLMLAEIVVAVGSIDLVVGELDR